MKFGKMTKVPVFILIFFWLDPKETNKQGKKCYPTHFSNPPLMKLFLYTFLK